MQILHLVNVKIHRNLFTYTKANYKHSFSPFVGILPVKRAKKSLGIREKVIGFPNSACDALCYLKLDHVLLPSRGLGQVRSLEWRDTARCLPIFALLDQSFEEVQG